MFLSGYILDSRPRRLKAFHLQMPRGLYRRYFSPGNYLSGETRDIEFAGGEMPFSKNGTARLDHSGTSRCSKTSIFLCRSAQRPLGNPRSNGRALPHLVVRWRAIPLHRTLLGPHGSSPTAPFRKEGRNSNNRPARRVMCVVQHGPGTCLV